MKFNWTCPFCQHKSTVHDELHGTVTQSLHRFHQDNKYGPQYLRSTVIVCPNDQCREYSIGIELGDYLFLESKSGIHIENPIYTPKRQWRLIPDSDAKVFPHYIPKLLIEDYREACSIRDLSPKASATLSRRCLQGIIRDFWKISKPRLIDEIEAIKDRVKTNTWEAIDAVRKVGNIGAHMEKDPNLIIDIEPNEAQLLIELIETLFVDWYITQHDQDERMKKLKELAMSKEQKSSS